MSEKQKAKSADVRVKYDRRNYRKHDERNKKLIRKSLDELGAGRSVLMDAENELIAGNGVFEQAEALGIKTKIIETDGSELVIVKRTDLHTEDEKRKKLALADNATSDSSNWDVDALKADWEPEELDEWGVEGVWEDDPEPVSGETEPDAVPDVAEDEPTVSVQGKVYQLGEHRLMCGDSTSADDVAKLMQGQKADMVFTDPPYGMGLDTDYSSMKNNLKMTKEKKLTGGKKYAQGKVDEFSPKMVECALSISANEVFLWGADYYAELLPDKNDGAWIVWDKRLDESADKMYGSCFELCWSKSKHKRDIARIKWAGVFGSEKEFDHKRHHPTQKPIALVAWFFERYGKAGETVVDLFGGSGSTLIACVNRPNGKLA